MGKQWYLKNNNGSIFSIKWVVWVSCCTCNMQFEFVKFLIGILWYCTFYEMIRIWMVDYEK